MRRRDFITSSLAALAAASAIAGAAEAGMKAGPNMAGPGHHRLKTPSGGGALDGFTQPSGAYSFRKLLSSYSGPAIRIRRASDNAELDIGFLGFTSFGGAPWDEAAANAHCASTSCFIETWYAQAGTLDLVQATAANQPQLVFNCNGNLPCLRTTTATQSLVSASTIAPATGVVTLNVVGKRAAGTAACTLIRENGVANRMTASSAGNWTVFGGSSGAVNAAASEAVWHSGIAVINGAASVFDIDDVETTGTATGNTTAGATMITAGAATTCEEGEVVIWDNYILPPAARAAWISNQRSYGWIP